MEIEEDAITAARNEVRSILQQMLLLQRQEEILLQRYPTLSQEQLPRSLEANAITRDAQKALPARSAAPAICSPPDAALSDSLDSSDPSLCPEGVDFTSNLPAGSSQAPAKLMAIQPGPPSTSSHSPSVATTSAKKERPPPIYLRQKEKWERVVTASKTNSIAFSHAKNTKDGIKIQVPSGYEHRRLTSFLKKEGIGFHTYDLKEERLLRIVIRGIPVEKSTESIKNDLLSQNFPVREVHRMFSIRRAKSYGLILVVLDRTAQGKAGFNPKVIDGISGFSFEHPHRNSSPSQCHRCQLFGHSARNCFARPRCVKCLGDHGTAECASSGPPSCVLCGVTGHTANYRGCSEARKAKSRSKQDKTTSTVTRT